MKKYVFFLSLIFNVNCFSYEKIITFKNHNINSINYYKVNKKTEARESIRPYECLIEYLENPFSKEVISSEIVKTGDITECLENKKGLSKCRNNKTSKNKIRYFKLFYWLSGTSPNGKLIDVQNCGELDKLGPENDSKELKKFRKEKVGFDVIHNLDRNKRCVISQVSKLSDENFLFDSYEAVSLRECIQFADELLSDDKHFTRRGVFSGARCGDLTPFGKIKYLKIYYNNGGVGILKNVVPCDKIRERLKHKIATTRPLRDIQGYLFKMKREKNESDNLKPCRIKVIFLSKKEKVVYSKYFPNKDECITNGEIFLFNNLHCSDENVKSGTIQLSVKYNDMEVLRKPTSFVCSMANIKNEKERNDILRSSKIRVKTTDVIYELGKLGDYSGFDTKIYNNDKLFAFNNSKNHLESVTVKVDTIKDSMGTSGLGRRFSLPKNEKKNVWLLVKGPFKAGPVETSSWDTGQCIPSTALEDEKYAKEINRLNIEKFTFIDKLRKKYAKDKAQIKEWPSDVKEKLKDWDKKITKLELKQSKDRFNGKKYYDKKCKFKFKGVDYTFILKSTTRYFDGTEGFSFNLRWKSHEISIKNTIGILWMGDLNRDGILDLIIDNPNNTMSPDIDLYLSFPEEGSIRSVANFNDPAC
ncbi:MAG: hypothetical protein CME70_04545 [Halobacteriovorax sp.]|nr:hypothetical protein [Halobacteriovorax sp.]